MFVLEPLELKKCGGECRSMVCHVATVYNLSEFSFLLQLLLCVRWVGPLLNNEGLSSGLYLSCYIASLPLFTADFIPTS